MLKFYWNGIKDNGGKLQRAHYSDSMLINSPAGTITIYGKRYRDFSHGVHEAFRVKDDSDIQTDYIVNQHIRVEPEHPLYAEVRSAMLAAKAHQDKISSRKSRYE